MSAPSHRNVLSRRLRWWLWLALLLPMAQASASWHAMCHARVERAGQLEDKALHGSACELCLAGCAIAAAAPAADPPGLPALPVPALQRIGAAKAGPSTPPDRPYQSRAPPLALD